MFQLFGNENIYYIEQRIKQVLDEGGRAICVFDADVTNWDAAEKKNLKNSSVNMATSLMSLYVTVCLR